MGVTAGWLNPFHKSSARDGGTSGRMTDKESALPATPNIDDLVEARERADAGLRLALPSLFDQTPEPEPAPIELDPEIVDAIAPLLDAAQANVIAAGAKLPLSDELQRHLNDVVNKLFHIGAVLGERRGS